MTVYVRRLTQADVAPGDHPISEALDAWKVYVVCRSVNAHDSSVLEALDNWRGTDRASLASGLRNLVKKAALGGLLEEQFNRKQCHHMHEFKRNGKTCKVWRVRQNDVRLLFYYGADRRLVIVEALIKREDKWEDGERRRAQVFVENYLDAWEASKVVEVRREE